MNETKQILESIIKNFSTDRINLFFRKKSNKYREINNNFQQVFDDEYFKNVLEIGEIENDDGNLVIYTLETQTNLTERVGKKAQYDKAKNILKTSVNQTYNAGIFIFYDQEGNFRFSLIYPESTGSRREWNNFKRFTYFVSKELTNKTFLQRIGDGDFSSIANLKDVFSVEPVNNKFFDEFREYFEKTKIEFEKSNKNTVCLWLKDKYSEVEYKEQINKFAYTFLGRIIFIYFIQRKGWVENEPNYLRKHIADENNKLIYTDFLEPLFFDVFSKKESERPGKIKEQYKNTPYLNGGLFERSELENKLAESNSFVLFEDKFIRDLILNFFENYNFTIDENSPDDQEVSIDPEMLGKVFENTLAEEERGKKGTFYTPREVVHFMVKDSLLQYLINETSFNRDKLHQFIFSKNQLEEINFTKEEIREIDTKLENVKILDPAVGSAAFPVEMMQVLVTLRKQLNVNVGKNINEVTLKKKFIRENLYGVDIDPGAIEIAKLRLWLALMVDYDKAEAEPLPNLDFQFRLGNSLQEKIEGIDVFVENVEGQRSFFVSESEFEKVKNEMIGIKNNFYQSTNESDKRILKKQFDNLEHKLIQKILGQYEEDLEKQIANAHINSIEKNINSTIKKIESLKQKIKDGTYKLFKPDFHFSEVFDRKDKNGKRVGGFDIVIGNPPYGVKIDDDIQEWHGLGSKDSYGIFISTSLRRFLKPKGVLSFIVSDTWLTIKTHKQLREQVLKKDLHKIIRVHQDCFDATVNACIMLLSNQKTVNNEIIAADLTNISTRTEVNQFRSKLYDIQDYIGISTPIFGVYKYGQDLIETNSNLPIFVGNPKIFALMNDTTCNFVEKEIAGRKINIRQIEFNGRIIELVRFGDIAEVKVGLQTGDNNSYLFQNPNARGSYQSVEPYKQYLLTETDLEKIANNEELRLKVINNGIHKSRNEKWFDEDLWFEGRFIVPYDKGGESDVESGWLPNYYVSTNYYIDWSEKAVKQLRSHRTARFQNTQYYFKLGTTLSYTGYYAPNLRINSCSVFDVGGSSIFTTYFNVNQMLGNFTCKLIKYFGKTYIDHTVNFQVDEVKEIPFLISENPKIITLVSIIIEKQKQNPRYDYISNEQKEIDKIVYEMYGLNQEDIVEVETWYARRYPKLARFCDI
ncbi:MAG TPA: N-6 DNA methylase [bacterium]|nr:N-6 DNA methylase [bacterium]